MGDVMFVLFELLLALGAAGGLLFIAAVIFFKLFF